ncbi:hypothetical protein [Helicobacter sp. 13S00477-4]|uniref:hypothetical protein n=1 Tax=Helicobacter sp. 13S00477-4 TaxID=1905759 RepID=UPI000BA62B06|nr:hypothetical protein [Helicobacter sp. 13S00477-4]PAF50637.1 hypothetical protein BKH44_07255 [Helicobacter sp. 13S00477-4]
MRFKYYIIFTIFFIIAVGTYIYSLNSGTYPLQIPHQSESVNLPIAIWISIVILIFFILSMIFFLGEWIRGLLAKYHNNKDFEKITNQIIEQNTKKFFTKQNYRNHHYALLSKILSRFELKANLESQNSSYYKIDKLFNVYKQIEDGNEQDVKKYNLSEDNEFFIKNIQYKIQKDIKFGIEILKGTFNLALKKYAFTQITIKGNDREIQKALDFSINFLDKEMLKELFIAYSQNRTTLDRETIAKLCKKAGYGEINYLRLAKEAKPFLSPDMWLKHFEYIADNDENAEKSYLYVLLDLEMIDSVNERLSLHSKNDFLIINAYLDLKKMGKNYPIDIFFGIQNPN